ncbi:MAG TPA: glycosyl hydrolase family 39 [Candidatus Sulfotelmatobacter sp.]|jgi:xylan 1,4-beta-xylosidase
MKKIFRYESLLVVVIALLISCTLPNMYGQTPAASDTLLVDGAAPTHPFPHFWEQMFGSGRAILVLRDSYRQDLRAVHQITDFEYVRFHAIFDDEVGIYDEDGEGKPVYDFSYVDQIYDGLLADGVKPFVEISFMPNKLAAAAKLQPFWYKPNVSPPKDWAKWDALIAAFVGHLIDRYGIDEVAAWYFEVWNEPNLDFWAGEPKQSTYWELYDHTVLAIKKVNARLRVGGPATAQAAWVSPFLQHCTQNNIPVDFVSTHVYGNDSSTDVFGTTEDIPRNQMVCRAVQKVHQQIRDSAKPGLPLIWSEFNASYKNETDVTDAVYMGPWLAETIQQCDGLVNIMSYWTFSDVFEEQGVVKKPFYGGYGLLAEDSIPKPAFEAFRLLHKLGNERLTLDSDSALVTRRENGSIVIAVWNYQPPEHSGRSRNVALRFKNINASHASVWRVDVNHGDFHESYKKMHEPRYPTPAQIRQLRASSEIEPVVRDITNSELELDVPASGLALIELK